jgi:tetratricopeptide (TPR) repeat protein
MILAGAGSVPIFNPDQIAPTPRVRARRSIASITARAVGDFVGRRHELREWPKRLLSDRWGGLVLHGLGGIGKTTLAAEIVERVLERDPTRATVVISGKVTVDGVLGAVSAELRQRSIVAGELPGPVVAALDAAARPDLASIDRLAILRDYVLGVVPLLVVLDEFDRNVVRKGDGMTARDPLLAELLAEWIRDPRLSRLLITSRYRFELPGGAHSRLAFEPVSPLSRAETAKLMWSLPALGRLSAAEAERVWRLVGGHPRSLEYLDALLSDGVGRYPDITNRLRALVAHLGADRTPAVRASRPQLGCALAEVATIAAEDVLLEELVSDLSATEGAKELLIGMSVYRVPVDLSAALYQVGEPDENAPTSSDQVAATARVEAILQEDLKRGRIRGDDTLPLPAPTRAAPPNLAEMVAACVTSSLLDVEDGDAGASFFVHRWTASVLARQLAEADQSGDLAAAHRRAAEYWRWRASTWPEDARAGVHHLLEARYHHLAAGQVEEAAAAAEVACSQLDRWGAWDEETALIKDTLDHLAPGNQRAWAWIVRLGRVAHRRGDLDEAERLYRRALEISDRLDDHPGIASGYHQLGILAQTRGDLDEAERLYRRALEISERRDDESRLATTYHQLGVLAHARGDLDEAERLYRQALSTDQWLGYQSGVAAGYHQLGLLAHARKDLGEAHRLYNQALEINERLGDLSSTAASYHQLGVLAYGSGDFDEAQRLCQLALEINERLGDVPRIATGYRQLARLAEERGDSGRADHFHSRALELEQRLGALGGSATDVPQLAVLTQARGDLREAQALNRRWRETQHGGENWVVVSSSPIRHVRAIADPRRSEGGACMAV